MATGLPSLVRKRRNCAPRYVSLCFKLVAAIFKAVVSRLLVGNRPLPMTFSPLTLLSGHRRSQETKWSSVRHLLMSQPASLITVDAVITSMPSIRVRSTPVIRNKASRISNCWGLWPLFFLRRFLRFSSSNGAPLLRSSRSFRYLFKFLVAGRDLLLAKLVGLVFLS